MKPKNLYSEILFFAFAGAIGLAILSLTIVLIVGLRNPSKANKVLEVLGYEEIQLSQQPVYLACDSREIYRDRFLAKLNGRTVNGVVCSGFFKDSTVRISE